MIISRYYLPFKAQSKELMSSFHTSNLKETSCNCPITACFQKLFRSLYLNEVRGLGNFAVPHICPINGEQPEKKKLDLINLHKVYTLCQRPTVNIVPTVHRLKGEGSEIFFHLRLYTKL
jgi:hypothetical protein